MSSNCVSAPTGTGTARGSEVSTNGGGGVVGKVDSIGRSGVCTEDVAMVWTDRRWAGHLRKRNDRRDHHDGFVAMSGITTALGAVFMLTAVLTSDALQTIRASRRQAKVRVRPAPRMLHIDNALRYRRP
jgi:hypothetical protein